MSRVLETWTEVSSYREDIVSAAERHAPNVAQILGPLCEALYERWCEAENNAIEISKKRGGPGNVCWVTLSEKRYCLSFNKHTNSIDLRCRSTKGPPMTSFDNNFNRQDLYSWIASL